MFSSANINKKWIGVNIKKKFKKKFNLKCIAYNDSDLAGISEISLNKKIDKKGTIFVFLLSG